MNKVWLVKFPTYQYEEDVKELAKGKGLTIVDDRYAGDIGEEFVEKSPPKLTKIKASK